MEADGVLKVFHFARFDIATLRYHLGIQVAPIFCTKIGSKLARTYTNRHGLKDLQELEQVELDKSAQSSDWATPPTYLMSNSATPPMMSATCLVRLKPIDAQTRRAMGTGTS